MSKAIASMSVVALLAMASGCGGGESDSGTAEGPGASHRATDQGRPAAPSDNPKPATATVDSSHCPPGLPSCRTAEGRIVYVERVDPDGDGDAHFVIVDAQGVTLPGLTAIDVRRGLRPDPLPGPGDLVSAAGPVQTGSYGQSQIHALELHVAGR
jgi:hypothetical protein